MRTLTLAALAMIAGTGFGKIDYTIDGDWRMTVVAEERKIVCTVDPPPRIVVENEEQVALPVFNPKKYECFRGRQFKGVYALGCSVKFALEPESVRFRDVKGAALVRGTDYEIEGPWGLFGRVEKGRIGAKDTVFADYAYQMRRLDSVVVRPSGTLVYRKGEPHVATPHPPTLAKGERAVLNVYVDAQTRRLSDENVYPVTEAAYPAPPAVDPCGLTVAAKLLPKTHAKLVRGEKVRILAWGDSVTETLDYYLTDKSARWQEVFVRRLRKMFPKAEIELLTAGYDGHYSSDFLKAPPDSPKNFKRAVLDPKPDLVISEFINDYSRYNTPEKLEKLYGETYLKAFQENDSEWIVMTPHYARFEQMKITTQKGIDEDKRPFVACLRELAARHGIALADASKRWGRLWRQGIPYMTLLCNDINHPDPRGLKLYADALVEDVFTAAAGGLERGILALNQDDSQFQQTFPAEKMTVEGAKEYFDLVNTGKNTHFFICPNAHCACFDSKVWDTVYRTDPDLPTSTNALAANTKLLVERGVDRFQIWIDRARERGISPWFTQRMNDIHFIGQKQTCYTSSFWLKHPEYRRVPGFDRDGAYPWEPPALDYQHQAVRDRALALARELLERWDVDGFECDWQRFPHQLSPEIEKRGDGARYLTAHMREMRKLVDEMSRKRGRKILLGVRVAPRIAHARGLGADAVAWAKEGLVDWVAVGAFFTTNDWGLECEEYRKALAAANPKVKLLVSFDKAGVMLDGRDYNLVSATRAECAGYFERMYAEGVRDFYGFNFFRYNPGNPSQKFVQGDGIPGEDALRAEARAYPVTFCDSTPEGMSDGCPFPKQLKDRLTLRIKIGKVGRPSETHVNVAFTEDVPLSALETATMNGVRVTKVSSVDAVGWLRRPRHANLAVKGSYRLDFPVSALKDGVNEVAVGPAPGTARACELFLGEEAKAASAHELTVAPDGLSPQAALETIRAAKAKGDGSAWTVRVRKGTYALDGSLVLTPADSGTPEAPVRWIGEKGAVFTGLGEVGPWRKTKDGTWEADIPKDQNGRPVHFEQLWMNGERAQRARIPNEGFLRCASATETPFKDESGQTRYRYDAVFTNKAEMAKLAAMPADELPFAQQFVLCHWSQSRRVLKGVDAATCRTTTESPWKSQRWCKWIDSTLFFFENVRAGFDAPGEWFYDAKAGKVRYWPRPGERPEKAVATTSAKKISRIMEFRGEPDKGRYVTDISFEKIAFEGSDPIGGAAGPTESRHYQAAMESDGCVSQTGTRRVDFRLCVFRHTGNYGMRFYDGCTSNRVSRCLFDDLGAGGLWIGSSDSKGIPPPGEQLTRRIIERIGPMSTAFVTVEDCVIRNGGKFNPEGIGVVIAHASDVTVTHNEISHFHYSGIEVGWTWGYAGSVTQRNLITFNRIHDLGGAGMSDMGGVYSNGTGFGTRVTDNVIYNVTAFDYGGWGLYTDEGSEGMVFERNLVWNTDDGGFHQHYGCGNLIRNNIFALNRRTGAVRMSQVRYGDMPGAFDFVNNIVYVKGTPLVGKLKSTGRYTLRGTWAGNLWWDASGKPVLDGKDWDGWKTSGQEICGQYADPGFVDPDKLDFRLKPNSPALALGFKPFDFSTAGVRSVK